MTPFDDPAGKIFSYGPFSLSRNCFAGRSLESYAFEYADQFFKTYPKDRKFFTTRITAPHEGTMESGKFVDVELRKLLDKLDSRGDLDNTLLVMYSDHGNHLNRIILNTVSGETESKNPFFFVMVPDWFDSKHGENLFYNRQKITTHFDIFESFWKLVSTDEKHEGGMESGVYSFFEEREKDLKCEEKNVPSACVCVSK